jgi:hypothetical protein
MFKCHVASLGGQCFDATWLNLVGHCLNATWHLPNQNGVWPIKFFLGILVVLHEVIMEKQMQLSFGIDRIESKFYYHNLFVV